MAPRRPEEPCDRVPCPSLCTAAPLLPPRRTCTPSEARTGALLFLRRRRSVAASEPAPPSPPARGAVAASWPETGSGEDPFLGRVLTASISFLRSQRLLLEEERTPYTRWNISCGRGQRGGGGGERAWWGAQTAGGHAAALS